MTDYEGGIWDAIRATDAQVVRLEAAFADLELQMKALDARIAVLEQPKPKRKPVKK